MNNPLSPTTSEMTAANRWDHFLARWRVNRTGRRVAPGLYALGNPTPDAPILVTANYTLSFDALRSALRGRDCYILVLDTQGINVWCAAGKGTFGTDELVHRIEETGLRDVVRGRTLILPPITAFITLNFTGTTTFASRSGVGCAAAMIFAALTRRKEATCG